MKAMFIVRAQVVDPSVKDAFDKWYQDEHLSEAIKPLIAEFDRAWGKKVVRTRDAVKVVQRIGRIS